MMRIEMMKKGLKMMKKLKIVHNLIQNNHRIIMEGLHLNKMVILLMQWMKQRYLLLNFMDKKTLNKFTLLWINM